MKKEECLAHKPNLPNNDWLPPILSNPGNWDDYKATLYNEYTKLYQNNSNKLEFNNKPVKCRRNPKSDGKDFTFWHLTSYSLTKDTPEEDRIPDFDRCEKISWPRKIIEMAFNSPNILIFNNFRKSYGGKKNKTKCLLLLPEKYLVVLLIKPDYYILKSAYFLDKKKSQINAMEEYCSFKNITRSN